MKYEGCWATRIHWKIQTATTTEIHIPKDRCFGELSFSQFQLSRFISQYYNIIRQFCARGSTGETVSAIDRNHRHGLTACWATTRTTRIQI